MLFVYPAIFHKDGTSFWVEFPDLEGCQTFGDSLAETMEFAEEALSGYILTLLEEKRDIPKPSAIEAITAPSDGFLTLISCKIASGGETKAVKKTLTIPSWLGNEKPSHATV